MLKKKIYTVTGMSCAGCSAAVQSALQKGAGVADVSVNLLESNASITYDDTKTSPEQLQAIVRGIGYDMLISDDPTEQSLQSDEEARKALSQLRAKLIVSAVLSVIMMVLGMHPHLIGMGVRTGELLNLFCASVVYFYCAGGYHVRALKQLRHRTFTMDTLISMSTTVAYFFSIIRLVYSVVGQSDLLGSSYFDVVGMIMTFVLLGKLLEERAKGRTNDALKKLVSLAPSTAIVEQDGAVVEKPVELLRPGEIVLLRKGDYVPVDGSLLSPGSFDESSLTGESLPADKMAGDPVYSGTVSVGSSTRFVAEKIGSETLLGKIIDAVRDAQASKAPIQRIADKVSGVFVPAILVIALMTFLAWGFLGDTTPWLRGLYHAISVLVIACPCALGLATPTAITVSMGRASEMGLLIRDAVALERLSKVTDIIFDKTGTLTEGEFRIVEDLWLSTDPMDWTLLSVAERHSSHLLAEILSETYDTGKSTDLVVNEVAGGGLSFAHEGHDYRIGNKAHTPHVPTPESTAFEKKHATGTLVYYTKDSKLIAIIALDDDLRKDTPEAIAKLSQRGLDLHLLSGDQDLRVSRFATKVSIDNAQGGMTALDKKQYIERLQSSGKVVAMVGDGINDSPALATADLSIAMSSGSDIATDVAQVTAITDSPLVLDEGIALSKRTVRIIYENFFWAFIYNLIAIPIAAGLFYPTIVISPMIAAAAMAMSSVCVVLNSLRLKK